MIKLTTPAADGHRKNYVAPANIARVTEAGPSSQWRGIRSIVRTLDGAVLECSETASEVAAAIAKAEGQQ
jgi:hypothetical protein